MSDPITTPISAPAPAPTKHRKWPWITGIVFAFIVGIGIAGSHTDPADQPVSPGTAVTGRQLDTWAHQSIARPTPGQLPLEIPVAPPAVADPPAPAPGTYGDGSYAVGTDIQPGTYHTTGPNGENSVGCYWERSKDTSGDSVTANDITKGPATVTISKTDGGFKTDGCNPWTKVS